MFVEIAFAYRRCLILVSSFQFFIFDVLCVTECVFEICGVMFGIAFLKGVI